MATSDLKKRREKHQLKFPLPEIGEYDLVYKGIRIPLEGGHRVIFGTFSQRLQAVENGWAVAPSGWTHIKELQAAAKYTNVEATRGAITKLNKKFEKFEKAGLRMKMRGNYKSGFWMSFSYKSTGTK